MPRVNSVFTNGRYFEPVGPETLATLGTQDTGKDKQNK
jgi:hypothetical protein